MVIGSYLWQSLVAPSEVKPNLITTNVCREIKWRTLNTSASISNPILAILSLPFTSRCDTGEGLALSSPISMELVNQHMVYSVRIVIKYSSNDNAIGLRFCFHHWSVLRPWFDWRLGDEGHWFPQTSDDFQGLIS